MDKKTTYIIVGVIVVIVIVAMVFLTRQPVPPAAPAGVGEVELPAVDAPGGDATAVINKELEGVDVGEIDAEFQSIDSDLESL